MNPESHRRLHARVDVDTAVQEQVLRLVSQGVDVCARMLGHDHEPGRARPRLGRAARMVAMEEVIEARGMVRVRGRPREPGLFEIEDASGA